MAAEKKAAEQAAAEKTGHPIGSKRCWISSNSDIAAGELGEVLGVTDAGLIRMKFAKGTWTFLKDNLLSKETWKLKVWWCGLILGSALLNFMFPVPCAL